MVHCGVPGTTGELLLPPEENKRDALAAMQFTHAQVVRIVTLSPKKWFKFSPCVHLHHLSEVSGITGVTP